MNGEEIIRKEGISGIYLNYNLTYFSLERHIWKEKEKSGEKKKSYRNWHKQFIESWI